jgi:molybdopterin-guanine dinucleotide biosynthesis protein A
VGGGRVERGGEKRSSSQFIGRGMYLAQEGGTGIAFNRKNARGQVEGSSWRGEMCPLRGLVMGLVSEAFEPYRLNETPCKWPMATTRMVAQLSASGGRADGWHKPAVNNLTVKTCGCSLDEHAGSDLEPCLQSRQRSVRIAWQHLSHVTESFESESH